MRSREREQLARELHDTVAHHVSAMVIRAQAGRVLAGADPAAAVEALEGIEEEGARTLEEMRAMVGALRDRGRRRRAGPARPGSPTWSAWLRDPGRSPADRPAARRRPGRRCPRPWTRRSTASCRSR